MTDQRPPEQRPDEPVREREVIVTNDSGRSGMSGVIVGILAIVIIVVLAIVLLQFLGNAGDGESPVPDEVDVSVENPADDGGGGEDPADDSS